MAFLYINGQELPSPKRGVKPLVSTVVDAGRNANGAVVGQRIGRDLYKIDGLEWPYLKAEEWARILQLLAPFFVQVTFKDPLTGLDRTVEMYPGDRSAEPYRVDEDGNPIEFINCRVNLVDTGRS